MFAPPSIAIPRVLALFATLTREEVGSNRPGCKVDLETDQKQDGKDGEREGEKDERQESSKSKRGRENEREQR